MYLAAERQLHKITGVVKIGPPLANRATPLDSAWYTGDLKTPPLPIYEAYRLNQAVPCTVQQGVAAFGSRKYGVLTLRAVNLQLNRGQFIRVRYHLLLTLLYHTTNTTTNH